MASITVRTQPITRDKIAAVTDDPRIIRFLENLAYDVTVSVPNALDEIESTADGAASAATSAQGIAISAVLLAQDVDTELAARVSQHETRLAVLEQFAAGTQDDGTLAKLETRLAVVESAVAKSQEDPTP